MAEVMKHASTFLLPHLPDNNRRFALVVLNHQLPAFTPLLWEHASLRVCADGGANRVYDEMPKLLSHEDPLDVRSRYKPDVIKGDMDSIRPEVQKFYTDLGTEVMDESHDQDTTDLHKCVSYVRDCTPDLVKPSLSILVAGALGGRFDHEIGNINVLHRFSDTQIILLSDDSIVCLLPKTHQHEIYIQSSVEGPHCGLFPVGRPSLCTTTTGLQWDLTESEMGFGGLISTSNIVREEKVPNVEGCKEDECQLTRTTYGRRFINKELNLYIAFLFETIIARSPLIGFPVSLSRYDLFHGHLFLAANSGRLGILFHAREYPAYEKKVFPYHMGYCQRGSDVRYDKSMNFRNILWLAPLPGKSRYTPWDAPGILVVLDAHPGGIIYKELVPDYVDYVRTIYEGDFGDVVVDVNYLNVEDAATEEKIFIC